MMLLDLIAAFFTSKVSVEWKIAAVLSVALTAVIAIMLIVR